MTLRTIGMAATALSLAVPAAAQHGPATMSFEPAPEAANGIDTRVELAWRNYRALAAGSLQLSQLSLVELEDVRLLDRAVRGDRPDRRSARQRCLDSELDRLGRAPSRLALRTIDLRCSQR